MHEIFENMDENAFNLEYVWLVDRRLRATNLQHFSPPDTRWLQNFARNYLVKVGHNKYKTPQQVFGLY